MRTVEWRTIFWITVAWVIAAVAEFGHTYSALAAQGCPMSAERAILSLKTVILSGTLAGLIGGAVMVFIFSRWLRTRPYGKALMMILGTFTLVFFVISLITAFFFQSQRLDLPLSHPQVVQAVFSIFTDVDTIRSYLFWFVVVLGTNITLLVNEKYGPGVFSNFLLGRYFRPRREERIFMFLDLRSSTTIAEQLGEQRYFLLIQELFRDVTPAILRHRGQIYQYVGDEVVVSWSIAEGLKQGRCVECFLEIQRLLRERTSYYQQKYEQQPVFKAGLHYGHVMAGEVGVVKREIAFSGDVLNTTARIQSKCNELGVNVLLSEKLVQALPAGLRRRAQELGGFSLRGKADEVVVYTLS